MIGSIENHRERETGVLVYPVFSRRSGGLSVGINLFPDHKSCSFDCPYCEVFPFMNTAAFHCEQMEADLRTVIASSLEQGIVVKDICFSGNGEPTMAPAFPDALKTAGRVRAELVPEAELVLITNGCGLMEPRLFSLLRDAAAASATDPPPLRIWMKLDAGTRDWYQKMNRSALPFDGLIARLKEFAACAPLTIQTMLCAVEGEGPPPEEKQAWEALVLELAGIAGGNRAGGIRAIQLYGKARPAPEDPVTTALPVEYLETRAASLRRALAGTVTVEVYP